MIAVIIPEKERAILLIAPISSPSSNAFDVPTTWLAVPIATPCATLLFTRNSFIMNGASIFPATPVKSRAVTVIDLIPPSVCEIAIAIGVVTLLGMSDEVSTLSAVMNLARRSIVRMDAALPAIVPAAIDAIWSITSLLSLYIE